MTLDEQTAALPPTAIPASVRRVSLMLIGSIAFVAAGVGFLIVHTSLKADIAGAVAVPFFGFCAVLLAARLIKRTPELVITNEGLSHRSCGTVSWEQISHVAIRTIRVRTTSQRMIEVVLHDPSAYLATAPRLARVTANANMRMGYSPYNISANTMPASLEQVLAEMTRHHPSLRVAAAT